jgi:ribosome maturation factor RimP
MLSEEVKTQIANIVLEKSYNLLEINLNKDILQIVISKLDDSHINIKDCVIVHKALRLFLEEKNLDSLYSIEVSSKGID